MPERNITMGILVNILLIGLCFSIVDASADCITEVQNNEKVKACMHNLMGVMKTIDHTNPRSMCTDDFKKHMGCLMEFLTECPEISSPTGPFAAILPAFEQFGAACSAPAAGKCPGIDTCSKNAAVLGQQPEMTPSGNSTPFSLVPVMIHSICRSGKALLECLNAHRDACPDEVKAFERSVFNSLAMDKTGDENYDMLKTYIAEDCPSIPSDFSSNKCVREKLEGTGFVSCMMNVKQLSSKAAAKEQCKFYFDGKVCIEEYIGKPCGPSNAKAIVDTAHWIIKDLPKNCDMFVTPPKEKDQNSSPPENGSSSIRVTLATLIMFIFAVFI